MDGETVPNKFFTMRRRLGPPRRNSGMSLRPERKADVARRLAQALAVLDQRCDEPFAIFAKPIPGDIATLARSSRTSRRRSR